MTNWLLFRLFLAIGYVVLAAGAVDNEPLCLSRYDYDYKMLQKTFSLEQEQKDLRQLVDKQSETIQNLAEVIDKMEQAIKDDKRQMEQTGKDKSLTGSTFVRWGRTVCPGNGTETIYDGYAGGSDFNTQGSAGNYLCLPTDPLWDKFDDIANGPFVYGTEYEIFAGTSDKFFNKRLGNHDAPCTVCHSIRSSTVMIPGRNACYDGWTMEYAGYLVAGHQTQQSATEFVCLDNDPEVVPGSQADLNGKLFYMAEAKCGSLKCPPYVNGRELTCVVCTR